MVRFVHACAFVCVTAVPAAAQDAVSLSIPLIGVAAAVPAPPPAPHAPTRPPALMPLYVSLAGLQGTDYVTTMKATRSGVGQELNPIMKPVVGNGAAFLAIKAGSAAGTIWLAERVWKRNRAGAIVLMVATNTMMAVVVGHNVYALTQVR